ncbi:MAG: helix-turn-helix transcriptional regulator [Chitinophagaceae bacterium]
MKEKSPDILEKFASNVARIRESKGLSLREVAAGCSLDHANISRIEMGKVDLRLTTLVEVAKGLGVHPRKLLDFEVE